MKSPAQKRARSAGQSERTTAARKAPNTSTMAAAALVPVDKPLTEKQKLFARCWAEGDSIANAAIRAGYNEQPSYGYRMAKMPNVLAAYNDIKRKYEEAAQMSRKKVMDMLVESYDMAKLMAEPATMVSAAREIGKMCGYFTVQHKVDVNVSGSVALQRLNQLSDADLLKLIESGGMPNPDDPALPAPGGDDEDDSGE